MYPPLLAHNAVSTFSFWHQGSLHKGIACGKELYGFYKKFSASERQEAFRAALEVTELGVEVCITCLSSEYNVWVSLKKLEQVSLCFLQHIQSDGTAIVRPEKMKNLLVTLGYRGWEIRVFKLNEEFFENEVYLPSGELHSAFSSICSNPQVALVKAKDFIDQQLLN